MWKIFYACSVFLSGESGRTTVLFDLALLDLKCIKQLIYFEVSTMRAKPRAGASNVNNINKNSDGDGDAEGKPNK